MKNRFVILMLDSVAIGVVAATLLLEAVLLFDPGGAGAGLRTLSPFVLGVIWFHLTMMIAPFGTLILLARESE
ncbi:MAG: hypothetical protein AAF390_09755 [Pseudomonadota bacterium]